MAAVIVGWTSALEASSRRCLNRGSVPALQAVSSTVEGFAHPARHLQAPVDHAHADVVTQHAPEWPGLSKVEITELSPAVHVLRPYEPPLAVDTGTDIPSAVERP